jgi:hypothetical protein
LRALRTSWTYIGYNDDNVIVVAEGVGGRVEGHTKFHVPRLSGVGGDIPFLIVVGVGFVLNDYKVTSIQQR